MKKELLKEVYQTPSVDTVNLLADAEILQMSSNTIPELGDTVTNPGTLIWS